MLIKLAFCLQNDHVWSQVEHDKSTQKLLFSESYVTENKGLEHKCHASCGFRALLAWWCNSPAKSIFNKIKETHLFIYAWVYSWQIQNSEVLTSWEALKESLIQVSHVIMCLLRPPQRTCTTIKPSCLSRASGRALPCPLLAKQRKERVG